MTKLTVLTLMATVILLVGIVIAIFIDELCGGGGGDN